MKTLVIVLAFVITASTSYSQALFQTGDKPKKEVKADGQPLRYEKIVECDSSLKKDYLFSRALSWYAKTFVDSRSVIEVQDRVGGQIIGNSVISSYFPRQGNKDFIRFRVQTFFKDGRCKIVISEFFSEVLGEITDAEKYTEKGMGKTAYNNHWASTKAQIKVNSGQLIKSFEEWMNNKEENW